MLLKRLLHLVLAAVLVQSTHAATAVTLPPAFVGSFEGLLQKVGEINPPPSGKVEITVAAAGKLTGKLTLPDDKKVYSLTGTMKLNVDQTFVSVENGVTLARGSGLGALNLALKVTVDGVLEASLKVPTDVAYVERATTTGVRLATFAANEPCPWKGTYTLALVDVTDPFGTTSPEGSGYAAVTIDAKGILKYTGKLADGTKLSGSLNPAADRSYRLFIKPYTAGGYFGGEITLGNGREDDKYNVPSTATARLAWAKTASIKDKVYPGGFGPRVIQPLVEPYKAPAAKALVQGAVDKPLLEITRFSVTLDGGGITAGNNATLPSKLKLNTANSLIVTEGLSGSPSATTPAGQAAWGKIFTGKITPATGVFTGNVTLNHVDSKGKTVARKVPYEGVILQYEELGTQSFGLGFYLVPPKKGDTLVTTSLSGSIAFSDPVTPPISPTSGQYTVYLTRDASGSELTSGVPKENKPIAMSIAYDLSSLTLDGRTVPLATANSIEAVFTDSQSSPTNNMTVTLVLDQTPGSHFKQPTGLALDYSKFVYPTLKLAYFTADEEHITKNP